MIQLLTARLTGRLDLSERGAGLVEYSLLVALIALVCVVSVAFLGSKTSTTFSGATSMMFP